jgi:hypothetical protein
MPRKAHHKRAMTDPLWKAVRIETTPGLYRLIAPLAKQKGKQKTLCIAIGNKRLRAVAEALNELDLEV